MDWKYLSQLNEFTSLSALSISCEPIWDGLYRLSRDIYVCTTDLNLKNTTNEPPYITAIVWAESLGAVRRCHNGDIEADEVVNGQPPKEVILPHQAANYHEIRTYAKDHGRQVSECAGYRASDGLMTHVDLNVDRIVYTFREGEREARPCLIQLGLPIVLPSAWQRVKGMKDGKQRPSWFE